jgi:hypothetical protein
VAKPLFRLKEETAGSALECLGLILGFFTATA